MVKRSNDLLGDLFGDLFGSTWSSKTVERVEENTNSGLRSYRSASDDDGMTLTVDLPGVDPKTVRLSVGGDKVVVSGKNRGKDFKQTYTLSAEMDVSTARATLRHGQLEIRIARSPAADMREIPIEII